MWQFRADDDDRQQTTNDNDDDDRQKLIALPLVHVRGVISVPRESGWLVLVAMVTHMVLGRIQNQLELSRAHIPCTASVSICAGAISTLHDVCC